MGLSFYTGDRILRFTHCEVIMSESVLVTGGTGFAGKHLVDRLILMKKSVRVFDFRPLSGADYNWADKVEFVQGDIRDKSAVEAACQGVDYVYHMAAIPSISRKEVQKYIDINVGGTKNVLESAKAAGARGALHISSSTVYGIPEKIPLTEEDVSMQIGSYGNTKKDAEDICLNISDSSFHINIIRPRVIMGAGRIGIFGLLFSSILNGKSVFMIGSGNNKFQFTDIGDFVDSCILASEYQGSEVFNIGSNVSSTVKQDLQKLIEGAHSSSKLIGMPAGFVRFILKFADKFGMSPLMNEQYSIADKDFVLSTGKAKELLGWVPNKTNYETLLTAYHWYKDNVGRQNNQYKTIFGVFGKFTHSQQGAFQKSSNKDIDNVSP
jgi:nucleoside-diphosphate-sugar epimerase